MSKIRSILCKYVVARTISAHPTAVMVEVKAIFPVDIPDVERELSLLIEQEVKKGQQFSIKQIESLQSMARYWHRRCEAAEIVIYEAGSDNVEKWAKLIQQEKKQP